MVASTSCTLQASNVSVKSKLQHPPPPRQIPGHLTFLKIIVPILLYPGQNNIQMPHTRVQVIKCPHPGDISQTDK